MSIVAITLSFASAACHKHDAEVRRDAAPRTIVAPVDALVLPRVPDAAAAPANAFVGSEKCGECHGKELAAWKKDWHARALAKAQGRAVVGDFANAHFTGSSSEAWMRQQGGVRTMRTKGPDGTLADFPVAWVVGGKRMQDAVTVFPDGRWQVLPIYFHVTGHEWVDYTEAKQGPLSPSHPFYWTNARRMANHECLDCHTTNLRVDHDDATGAWTTTFTDPSVACESCHGPGGKHSESQEKADIIHPAHAKDIGVAACARCHGPRKPLWPLNDPAHPFVLGESYDEYYDPIVITMPGGGTSSDFLADGRPGTSSFEYQAMLQSACYRKGGATCLTCHAAPHDAHRPAELRKDPNELCRGCHADEAKAGAAHTHHKAAAAQKCIACHMPPVVSGVLDHFADHAIDVPDPANTAKHGTPNACSLCHADHTPDQLATSVAEWWPDSAKRLARRERLADAFDDKTARESAKPLLAVTEDLDEAPTVRGAAIVLMARRFGPQSAPKIAPQLQSTSVILRAKACEALGDAHATAAAGEVAARLTDPSLRVRLACALALKDMRDPRGEAALQALADDPATSHLMLPHLELGMARAGRSEFVGAKHELEQVATLAPSYVDALVDLAAVDAELGDFAEARRRLAQVVRLEPANPAAAQLQAKLPPPK